MNTMTQQLHLPSKYSDTLLNLARNVAQLVRVPAWYASSSVFNPEHYINPELGEEGQQDQLHSKFEAKLGYVKKFFFKKKKVK